MVLQSKQFWMFEAGSDIYIYIDTQLLFTF